MPNKNNSKNYEVNISPLASGFRELIIKSGMHICSYYENVPSGIKHSSNKPCSKKNMRKFPFFVLTHLINGDGVYADEDSVKWLNMEPGWGVIATPFNYNCYGGKTKRFIEDSIAFDGKTANILYDLGIIKAGLIYIGKVRALLPIINKLREGTISSSLEANIMLQGLLFKLNHERAAEQKSVSHAKITDLLGKIKDNPSKWWTVSSMAEYCNISENYLRILFHKYTGLSPKAYVDNIKMNRAQEMLNNPQIKVYEIAERMGYVDNYHFIRRFTKVMGISPGRYRKNILYK